MVNNNNGNGLWLNHTLFKLALTIILLAGGAWASWVTTTINKDHDALSEIRTDIARITQMLSDHMDKYHGDNPRTVSH